MRFDQQKSACSRVFAGTMVWALSASGSGVFAFGQGQGAQAPAPPVAAPAPAMRPATPSTGAQSGPAAGREHVEDFVGRRGQDGAREQPGHARRAVGPADSDIRRRAGPRRLWAEPLLDHHQPQQHDAAGDFLTGTGATLTNDSLRTNAGVQQLVPWGGGRYNLAWDASKLTTSDASSRFNPQLDSGLSASVHPAAAAQLHHRQHAADAAPHQNRQQVADLELRQTLTQTSRAVRNAYFDLVNAIAGLQVAQQSLELTRTSLQEQRAASRGRHDGADRHRPGAGGGRSERGIGDRRRGPDSRPPRIACARW